MDEDIAKEIQQMLKEAWEKLRHDYDERVTKYKKSLKPEDGSKEEQHWVYWNEYDLMFHIGRLFYDLSKKKEPKYSDIEIHFEKKINKNNFKGYPFEGRLIELNNKLDMKNGPKVDMIFAKEDALADSFLLCAEVKCFHGPAYWAKNPIEMINDDIEKLKAIKEIGIAKEVVFMIFDDYYYLDKDKKTKNGDIKHKLKEVEEIGIPVLYGNSIAKI